MALTFIPESVASAIIDSLVNTCFTYLKACPAASGMQDELERLRNALPQVQEVLTALEGGAPDRVQNEVLRRWLWQLRDGLENAEDVLDELDYYELEKSIQYRDDKLHGNIFSKYKKKYDSLVNRMFSDDTLKQLREAVKGLDRVVASMGPFLQIATWLDGPSVKHRMLEKVKNARRSCSVLTESMVLGRDKERDTIVEWLIKPVDGESGGITLNVSAYTIVGMGGFGKTTLAQLIYQDERVQEYFNPIIWVCVSQDFNAAAIIRKMLKVENSGKSLDALHEDLKQKLTSNRFLLILDDVWNDDNMSEWEKLVAPLKFGQRGSKILLTTQMGSVADMAARVMQYKRESLDLKELEESDCMSLFNKHASLDVNPDDYKNLQPICEQIVKKLGGCPLAIKIVGGMLYSCKDYDEWNRILKEDTKKVQQGKDGIMTILKLSYDHLPTNLQVCFRYCSIFPQDYEFKRKELAYMWMGSGLIPESICGRWRSPEDIGREYFDLLTRKSFFTCKTSDNESKLSKRYFMHNLLHDLAQFVSVGECIRIGSDVAGNIPKTVRHLSFENINFLSITKISNLKNLRTLVISIKENYEHNVDHLLEFNKVVEGFKKLHLLSIDVNLDSYKLPDALNSLIHLRYLSVLKRVIVNESFKGFFRSTLCRLYHLEFLKLSTYVAPDIIEYDGLTNLVNLRSLDVPKCVLQNIPYISKLPFIRKLEDFFIREKSGYKISELKNLRDLHHLCIRELENVRTSEEAMEAKLNEKEYLKSLTLGWSKGRSNSVEMDEPLLDKLCPHINLKRLSIEEYQGVNSPHWMSDLSLINNLTSIELMDCKGWEHLPPLGLLPFLNHLYLVRLHAVKKMDSSFCGSRGGCAFPSLKDLFFEDLPNLEEWIEIDNGCMFHKLHTMEIIGCPKLMGLPTLPCSIRILRIEDVGLTALPTINENCGNNNQQKQFSNPETLIIEDCEKLQYLPTEFFQIFNTIKVLTIRNCPKWEEWIGIDDGCMFPKLHTMRITRCPNSRGIPTLPRSLKHLSIFNVGLRDLHISNVGLTALPAIRGISNIQQPSILDESTIGSCGDLEVLLQCLANLTSLTISGLHGVKKIDSSFFGSNGGCAFPSLKDLYFDNLPNLEKWIGIDDCCMFPKLDTMKIINCANLSGLPTLPCSLRELCISNVGLTALPAINEDCGNNNQQEKFSALETLTIKQCEKLEYLPTELFQKFNTLKELSINYCPKLTIRGISDIQLPSILNERTIGSCGDLEVLLLCSSNLTFLNISGLHAVKKIDSSFFGSSRGCAFPLLEYLYFDDLPNLEEWIGIDDCCMFPKLDTMRITNCPNLRGLPTLPCSLTDLYISNVGLTALPAIDENCRNNNQLERFPALETLTIKQCEKLQYLPTEFFMKFNTIEYLYFTNLPNLEEWIEIDDGCMFPKLDSMEIINCPNLNGLPALPCSLRKLVISNVGLTALPAIDENCGNNNQLERFLALETLTIKQCEKLQYLPTVFLKKFNTIEYLYFTDLPNLECWIGIDDGRMFPKLDTMEIINCPNLSGLPTLPCNLRKLFISNVGLTALPAIHKNCENNNQDLTIEQCDKLEYIPIEIFLKFKTVKFLRITNCPKLTTRGISDIRLPSILDELTIESCGDLAVHLLLLLPNLTSLTELKLHSCASIASLPTAQVCSRWMKLSNLIIMNCKELSSFGGIQALVSLRWLVIRGCDKLIEVALRQPPFPNDVGQKNAADCFLKLGKLSIDHHSLLLMEPLRSLSSISTFTISDASRLTSLPEEWLLQNHSALKTLSIWNACSLLSLPQSMTQLCSLESLEVYDAKLIQSLPYLPTSLRALWISGCHPELKERCQENIGLDWPKIANIPYVVVHD